MLSGTFYAHLESSHLAPVLAYDFLSRCKFSTPTSTLLYSSIIRLYPQNPVFKIVHDESVKFYLPMYNGNVQQNPLCVESCVTKKFSMSPLFSSTFFYPDANSVLLRAHLCTAVDSKRRKPCVRNCSRKREGLYSTGKSSRTLNAQHPVSLRIFTSLPGSRPRFFIAMENSVLLLGVQQNPLCVGA